MPPLFALQLVPVGLLDGQLRDIVVHGLLSGGCTFQEPTTRGYSGPRGAPSRSLQGDIVVPGGAPFSRLQRGEIVVPGGAPFRSLQQGDIVTPSPPSQCWSISILRVEYVTEVLVIWSNFCLTFSIITLAVFNVVLSLDVKNKIGTYM